MSRNSLRTLAAALFGALALSSPSAAEAPKGRFTLVRGTVEDASTGLTWQQKLVDKRYNWAEATAFCVSLDLRGKGWRLPTVKELHTLVDETRVSPAIDVDTFPDTFADYFWSSSPLSNFADNAWALSFDYGFDNWFDVGTKQRVRCVR